MQDKTSLVIEFNLEFKTECIGAIMLGWELLGGNDANQTSLEPGYLNFFGDFYSMLRQLHTKSYFKFDFTNVFLISNLECCNPLEKLAINADISFEIFKVHFPKLRELRVLGNRLEISEVQMAELFHKHLDLVKLEPHIHTAARRVLDVSSISVITNH